MATKKTVATPTTEKIVESHEQPKTLKQTLHAAVDDMFNADRPTWQREVTACVLSIAVSAGTGYVVGYVVLALAVGAVMLTASMWLFWVIYALGVLIAFYAGAKLGGMTYVAVIDKSVDRSWNKVKGWFKSTPVEVHHV